MNDSIQQLDDAQLDAIVGGAGLPAAFDRYLNEKGGIRVYTETAHSRGSLTVAGDRLGEYLSRLESRGVSKIGLYPGGGDKVEMHSLKEVMGWLK
ncbi:hypothetical protein QUW15_03215 [Desulfovibrio piger]|nr:hypothetical protein [Desulfovibrio piger]